MDQYIRQGTAAFRRANFALFLAGFVTFANLYSTQPLFPVFVKEFSVSPVVASLSLSLTTLSLAFGLLVFGSLSEAWGRKKLMAISLVVASSLTLIVAIAPTFELLMLLRILQGIVFAGVPSIAMAYLGEEIEGNSLGVAMGLYISGNTIGGLAGRIIIGTLSDLFSWESAIVFLGTISMIASLAFVFLLPSSRHFVSRPLALKSLFQSLLAHVKDPLLVPLFFIAFFMMGGFVTVYNYLGFRLIAPPYELSLAIVSWLFLAYLVGTFSSTWFGVLAKKFGYPPLLIAGTILTLCGVLLTLLEPLLFIIVGLIVLTFGFFGAHSIASGSVSRYATHDIAQASSLYLFAYYFGSSVGGSLGGIFWSHFGWSGVVAWVSFLLIISIVLGRFVQKMVKTKRARSNKFGA